MTYTTHKLFNTIKYKSYNIITSITINDVVDEIFENNSSIDKLFRWLGISKENHSIKLFRHKVEAFVPIDIQEEPVAHLYIKDEEFKVDPDLFKKIEAKVIARAKLVIDKWEQDNLNHLKYFNDLGYS